MDSYKPEELQEHGEQQDLLHESLKNPDPYTTQFFVSFPRAPMNPQIFLELMKTLPSKTKEALPVYRRDIREFRSCLKRETAEFCQATGRAIKDVPEAIEITVSIAQESLESLGQVIDTHGSLVWRRIRPGAMLVLESLAQLIPIQWSRAVKKMVVN